SLKVVTRSILLGAVRESCELRGSRNGCGHGQACACAVLIDCRLGISCLTLAVMHPAQKITTVEGLGTPDKMHPMQAAFVKHDGFQCGYCTPGQICSAVGMLTEIEKGIPSHVTADLDAGMRPTPGELR